MLPIKIIKTNQSFLLLPPINSELSHEITDDWFEIDFWRNKNAVIGSSVGRNITWFIRYTQHDEWVLRHYYRGGLVAKFLSDSYFFSSIENTRCYQELNLLETMYQQNLPVPKPIAARVTKRSLCYQADIIIEKIPNAQDLANKLKNHEINQINWQTIGKCIALFHHSGINHSDLNAHNILIDDNNKVWLVDFDKCEKLKPNEDWQEANLVRLKRSFEKEVKLHSGFHYNQQCWQWLKEAYYEAIAEPILSDVI